jgi:hypothetical protein
MSAVAVTEFKPKARRFEDSAVQQDLKYWGYHKGKQLAADGYPAGQTIKELMAGDSGRPGHKILVRDMPPRAWQINAMLMRLPDHLIEVLVGRYCLPCKPNGNPYESDEIAEFIGVTRRTYFRHLNKARSLYKTMIFA